MHKKRRDQISMMKMQDMIDVFYILSHMRDNSYNQNYSRSMNNKQPINKAENLIRIISENKNMNSKNVGILIDILRNIEMLNNNGYINKISSNPKRNSTLFNNDIMSKIKFFLNSLNDEE